MAEQTIGERRVVIGFNPGMNVAVEDFKRNSAVLINSCEILKSKGGEAPRWAALAQTAYEEACMWAVKAATA